MKRGFCTRLNKILDKTIIQSVNLRTFYESWFRTTSLAVCNGICDWGFTYHFRIGLEELEFLGCPAAGKLAGVVVHGPGAAKGEGGTAGVGTEPLTRARFTEEEEKFKELISERNLQRKGTKLFCPICHLHLWFQFIWGCFTKTKINFKSDLTMAGRSWHCFLFMFSLFLYPKILWENEGYFLIVLRVCWVQTTCTHINGISTKSDVSESWPSGHGNWRPTPFNCLWMNTRQKWYWDSMYLKRGKSVKKRYSRLKGQDNTHIPRTYLLPATIPLP